MKEVALKFNEDLGRFAQTTGHKVFMENCVNHIFKVLDEGIEKQLPDIKHQEQVRKILADSFRPAI